MQQGYQQQPMQQINQYRIEFEDAVKSAFQDHYCDFTGRVSRSEFWWPFLAIVGSVTILQILSTIFFAWGGAKYSSSLIAIGWIFEILMIIVNLGSLLPMLGLYVRRLHDIGKSGMMLLIALIPFIGIFILLYWCSQESEPYQNQYGPVPNLLQ